MPTSSFATNALRAFALGLLLCAGSALASGPTLTYQPAPDAAPVDPNLNCGGDISTTPGAEVEFAPGSCPAGQPCTTSIGIQAAGGTGDITSISSCSVARLSGDAIVSVPDSFGIAFPTGGNPSSGAIPLTCERRTLPTRARVCCKEQNFGGAGGGKTAPFWDVACPALGSPEFHSTPAANTELVLQTVEDDVGGDMVVITISNPGIGPLTVTPGPVATGLSVQPSSEITVLPNDPQTFVVGCAASEPATITSTLTLTTNDADEGVVTFPVTCTVAPRAPGLDIDPPAGATLTMSSNAPMDASATVTISNPGAGDLHITSIGGLTGALSTTLTNAVVEPDGDVSFDVVCDGDQPGGHSGTLIVTSDAPGRQTISLLVACSIADPELVSEPEAPTRIDLSATRDDMLVATSIVEISNNGVGDLVVALGLSGGNGVLSISPTAATLQGGREAPFTISCPRAVVGQFTATLTIQSNDPDENEGTVQFPVTCNITSMAAPEFSSNPGVGALTIATSANVAATTRVRITNAGTAGLELSGLVEGAAGGTITVAPSATLPTTLAPTASLDLDVRCSSATAGTFNDTFRIMTNDTDEPLPMFSVACAVEPAPQLPEVQPTPAVPGPITITTNLFGSATLRLENTGNSRLDVGLAGLTSPLSIDRASAMIAAGTSESFVVNCFSRAPGTFNRTLTVTTNDPDEPTLVFNVVCNVQQAPPEYSSDPPPESKLVISAPAATDSLATGNIQISNAAILGAQVLTVVPGGLSAPLSAGPPLSIPPAGIIGGTLTLSCAPRTVGSTRQLLLLDTNAPKADPAVYDVTCTGTPGPDVDATPRPGALVLSMQATFKEPTHSTIRVRNVGATTLSIPSVPSLIAPLQVAVPVKPPLSIAPGAFVDLNVSCGGMQSANTTQTLVLGTNDPDETQLAFGIRCRVTAPDLLFEADFEGPTLVPIDDDLPIDD